MLAGAEPRKSELFWRKIMKKFLTIAVSLTAIGLAAQTTTTPPVRTYPDIVTSQTNASIALTSYKSNLEGYISQDGTDI